MKNLEERLKSLIGKEFDEDDVIVGFESEDKVIVGKIVGQESNFEGHGMCDCYNAYEDKEESETYSIYVNSKNIIVDIK